MVRHATLLELAAHRRNFIDCYVTANPASNQKEGCLAEPKQLLRDRQPAGQHRLGLTIFIDPRARH
ncbi:MAG: hypothetical protein ACJA0V_003790 [Planctomycetota bacterium]|jgi:hypothetical protein